MGTRFYPPTDERRAMRRLIMNHLREHPARYAAPTLVTEVMANGGGDAGFDKGELKLELSRMVGTEVRLNANNSLVATH